MAPCLVVGDDVAAEGTIAVDRCRQLSRRLQRERLADLRVAGDLEAGQVERAERDLAGPAVGPAEAHLPSLVTGKLDDEEQATGAGVADAAPLGAGRDLAAGGVGENLGHAHDAASISAHALTLGSCLAISCSHVASLEDGEASRLTFESFKITIAPTVRLRTLPHLWNRKIPRAATLAVTGPTHGETACRRRDQSTAGRRSSMRSRVAR